MNKKNILLFSNKINRVMGILPMKHGQDGHATNIKLFLLGLVFVILTSGCIERELKINTTPQGAMVELNDEQIGQSPVTVSFNWYGDYYVRATKDGYETLNTHKMLKAPWYDHFPFDFFVGVLWPQRIVDSYEWTFELKEQEEITREKLLQKAENLQKEMVNEELLNAIQNTEN